VAAEAPYEEARRIRLKVLGSNHPDYAQSLRNLASLNQSLQRYPLAEQQFQE
jgi:hypothetical protein